MKSKNTHVVLFIILISSVITSCLLPVAVPSSKFVTSNELPAIGIKVGMSKSSVERIFKKNGIGYSYSKREDIEMFGSLLGPDMASEVVGRYHVKMKIPDKIEKDGDVLFIVVDVSADEVVLIASTKGWDAS